jgi:hypothetical protein
MNERYEDSPTSKLRTSAWKKTAKTRNRNICNIHNTEKSHTAKTRCSYDYMRKDAQLIRGKIEQWMGKVIFGEETPIPNVCHYREMLTNTMRYLFFVFQINNKR